MLKINLDINMGLYYYNYLLILFSNWYQKYNKHNKWIDIIGISVHEL